MIYIHVPFCKSFCIYCGFYSELAGRCGTASVRSYAGALKAEADARKDEIILHRGDSCSPRTLYFGGGTPSVMPNGFIQEIIGYLDIPRLEEVTVEVNPDDIARRGPGYVRGLIGAGVNRFSIGIQSFDDGILRWMRRRHNAAAALRAVDILRNSGAGNISIDLIFGLPQEDLRTWKTTLEKALEVHPEHISAYQLSVDEGSDLYAQGPGAMAELPSDELCRQQYDLLCDMLGKAGYRHYEVSNFALPGYESRHNSAYWDRLPYVGLGPGAHSFMILPDGRQLRFSNQPDLKSYIAARYTPEREALTPEQIRIEELMLGLRRACGIPSGKFRQITTPGAFETLSARCDLVLSDGRIRIPEDRLFISDAIIRSLV